MYHSLSWLCHEKPDRYLNRRSFRRCPFSRHFKSWFRNWPEPGIKPGTILRSRRITEQSKSKRKANHCETLLFVEVVSNYILYFTKFGVTCVAHFKITSTFMEPNNTAAMWRSEARVLHHTCVTWKLKNFCNAFLMEIVHVYIWVSCHCEDSEQSCWKVICLYEYKCTRVSRHAVMEGGVVQKAG